MQRESFKQQVEFLLSIFGLSVLMSSRPARFRFSLKSRSRSCTDILVSSRDGAISKPSASFSVFNVSIEERRRRPPLTISRPLLHSHSECFIGEVFLNYGHLEIGFKRENYYSDRSEEPNICGWFCALTVFVWVADCLRLTCVIANSVGAWQTMQGDICPSGAHTSIK